MLDSISAFTEQINSARADRKVVRIQGGGSKNFYGNALDARHEVLDTRTHSGIVSYESEELVVTVKAGTLLLELQECLRTKDQYLAFAPPHFSAHTTVGGMVAAGLAGSARSSVGGLRDYVLGVQMINGAGELLQFGGTVMKNVAGYDVSRVLAGSMGTLGLITQVSLKVLPIPLADLSLSIEMSQADALQTMNAWRIKPLPIHAACWVRDADRPLLFVRLRGAQAAVSYSASQLQEAHAHQSPCTISSAPTDWQAADDQTLPWFAHPPSIEDCLWRLSVPPATPVLAIPRAVCAHEPYVDWQGGLRWYWARANAAGTLRSIATQVGGHATLFRTSAARGDNDKTHGVFQASAPALAAIQKNLLLQLDPSGVFATGRI